jgi:hypothetical protein
MTITEMRELVKKHADLEMKFDLDGVLGTLVECPVYEFYPARLKLEGKKNVREFYRDHFDYFFPKIKSHQLINEWWKADVACLEYDLYLKEPLAPNRTYRILVVLTAKYSLLLGERFYVEDDLVKLMTGNSYRLLEKF